MSLVALCSAHAAPGVTTAALVLAAAWPPDRGGVVVVEADPSGGVVAARFGLGDNAGLASLAVASRSTVTPDVLGGHVQELPGGLPVVVGPATPEQAAMVLPDVTPALVSVSATLDVVVDAGRVLPGSPTMGLLRAASVVLVVVRPSPDQLRPVATRVGALQRAGVHVAVCLIGTAPYGLAEVETVLGVEVAGVLAWDPRSADALSGADTPRRGLRHMPLARSAATLAEHLAVRLTAAGPVPEGSQIAGGVR